MYTVLWFRLSGGSKGFRILGLSGPQKSELEDPKHPNPNSRPESSFT